MAIVCKLPFRFGQPQGQVLLEILQELFPCAGVMLLSEVVAVALQLQLEVWAARGPHTNHDSLPSPITAASGADLASTPSSSSQLSHSTSTSTSLLLHHMCPLGSALAKLKFHPLVPHPLSPSLPPSPSPSHPGMLLFWNRPRPGQH